MSTLETLLEIVVDRYGKEGISSILAKCDHALDQAREDFKKDRQTKTFYEATDNLFAVYPYWEIEHSIVSKGLHNR